MNEHSKSGTNKPGIAGTRGVAEVAGSIGSGGARDALTEVLRTGAVKLLASAVQAEVAAWIDDHAHVVAGDGRRQVVRNGSMPEREVVTGIGPVKVKQPRVHDRRPEPDREKFTSAILPPYLRKTRSMEELIPWLYLKGVSSGDFSEALAALIGADTPGLSASTVTRLKESWEVEYKTWSTRDLAGKNYVYVWADGVHFNVRLGEQDRQCILVLMGATADGKKALIAVADGFRESEQSWKELLLDIKSRGMAIDPKLAIGDGALGFWKALPQVFPTTRTQRCWVHKTANVLNKLPKQLHGQAKDLLHQVWMAPTKAAAEKSFDLFLETYTPKYASAAECLAKDRAALLAFYDFPAEHWSHLRTTNAIESVFATVRLRTDKTKGSGSRTACLTMVFKLTESASKKWRSLNGSDRIREVLAGAVFVDGVQTQTPEKAAA
ncbi:MAG: IS256 family transposase [Phycisphaerales bacterium]